MSAPEMADEADDEEEDSADITKNEFFDRLTLEGVTIDSGFFMARGEGRQRRYFRYDPGLVKGLDPIRGDDGETVAQQVANHEEAVEEQETKDHLEETVFPKVRDGFGIFGLAEVESAEDEGQSPSGDSVDYEPMTDDEVLETIRENYDEHGMFAEDEEGDEKVVSLAHPEGRLMGYITGSHVKSLPGEGLESVDDYRAAVYQAITSGSSYDDSSGEGLERPDDVPIAPDAMMEVFEESGGDVDEETREKLSRQVERRWEDGEYDHLRKDDENDGGSDEQ